MICMEESTGHEVVINLLKYLYLWQFLWKFNILCSFISFEYDLQVNAERMEEKSQTKLNAAWRCFRKLGNKNRK